MTSSWCSDLADCCCCKLCETLLSSGKLLQPSRNHHLHLMTVFHVHLHFPFVFLLHLFQRRTLEDKWHRLLQARCPGHSAKSIKALSETHSSDLSKGKSRTSLTLSLSTTRLPREGVWLHLCWVTSIVTEFRSGLTQVEPLRLAEARCSTCHITNSIKALKGYVMTWKVIRDTVHCIKLAYSDSLKMERDNDKLCCIKLKHSDSLVVKNCHLCVASRQKATLVRLTTKIIHLCTGPVITVSYISVISYMWHWSTYSQVLFCILHIRINAVLLWLPCVADADIIFLPCGFYISFFFPRLISAVADCMSTILWHMMWP